MYCGELLLALEDGLLRLVGAADEPPAGELGQDDVQFEFGDQLLQLFVDLLELAVAQFGYFRVLGDVVSHLQYVCYFIVELGLMMQDLRL